jgi:outer membrane protein TolC
MLSEARERRPELRALSHQADALREQALRERAAYAPRLDAFANGYYQNPHPRVFPQSDEFRGSWPSSAASRPNATVDSGARSGSVRKR